MIAPDELREKLLSEFGNWIISDVKIGGYSLGKLKVIDIRFVGTMDSSLRYAGMWMVTLKNPHYNNAYDAALTIGDTFPHDRLGRIFRDVGLEIDFTP